MGATWAKGKSGKQEPQQGAGSPPPHGPRSRLTPYHRGALGVGTRGHRDPLRGAGKKRAPGGEGKVWGRTGAALGCRQGNRSACPRRRNAGASCAHGRESPGGAEPAPAPAPERKGSGEPRASPALPRLPPTAAPPGAHLGSRAAPRRRPAASSASPRSSERTPAPARPLAGLVRLAPARHQPCPGCVPQAPGARSPLGGLLAAVCGEGSARAGSLPEDGSPRRRGGEKGV